VKTVKLRLHTR